MPKVYGQSPQPFFKSLSTGALGDFGVMEPTAGEETLWANGFSQMAMLIDSLNTVKPLKVWTIAEMNMANDRLDSLLTIVESNFQEKPGEGKEATVSMCVNEAKAFLLAGMQRAPSMEAMLKVGTRILRIVDGIDDKDDLVRLEVMGITMLMVGITLNGDLRGGMEFGRWQKELMDTEAWKSAEDKYCLNDFSAYFQRFHLYLSEVLSGKSMQLKDSGNNNDPCQNTNTVLCALTIAFRKVAVNNFEGAATSLSGPLLPITQSLDQKEKFDQALLRTFLGYVLVLGGKPDESIIVLREAENLMPYQSYWWFTIRDMLGFALAKKYMLTREKHFLYEARDIFREVWGLHRDNLIQSRSGEGLSVTQSMPVFEQGGLMEAMITLYQEENSSAYIEEIYEVLEFRKSIQLRRKLSKVRLNWLQDLPKADAERLVRLEDSLSRLRFRLETLERQGGGQLRRLRTQLLLTEERFQKEWQKIGWDSEKLREQELNSIPKLKEVQEMLFADEAIVSYYALGAHSITIVVTPDTVALDFLRENNYTPDLPQEFVRSIQKNDFEAFRKKASEMYGNYFRSIASVVEGKRLRIVRDGQLDGVPFEAFTTQPYRAFSNGVPDAARAPQRDHYHALQYLIQIHEISYLFSIASFCLDRKNGFPELVRNIPILAFAPGSFTSEGDQNQNPKVASRLARRTGGRAYIGKRASKDNFWENVSDFACLYLGSHAQGSDTAYPRIYFSGNHDSGEDSESLYLWEVQNTDLDQELLILAACETGNGKNIPGEGIAGFPQTFLSAGVQSVIYSHWEVDEYATNPIIEKTVEYLQDGMTRSGALWQAKLDYMKISPAHANPRKWAGLQLVGSTEQLRLARVADSSFWWKLILILLAGISLFKMRGVHFRKSSACVWWALIIISVAGCRLEPPAVGYGKFAQVGSDSRIFFPDKSDATLICYGDKLDLSRCYRQTINLDSKYSILTGGVKDTIFQNFEMQIDIGYVGVTIKKEPVIMGYIRKLKTGFEMVNSGKKNLKISGMDSVKYMGYEISRGVNGEIVTDCGQGLRLLCDLYEKLFADTIYIVDDSIGKWFSGANSMAGRFSEALLLAMVKIGRTGSVGPGGIPDARKDIIWQPPPKIMVGDDPILSEFRKEKSCMTVNNEWVENYEMEHPVAVVVTDSMTFTGWDRKGKYLLVKVKGRMEPDMKKLKNRVFMNQIEFSKKYERTDYLDPRTGFMAKSNGTHYTKINMKMFGLSIEVASQDTESTTASWVEW